ncbi:MAG: TRAP transporter small permease subunit [Pseudomonadota bacterium]|nr:TRAP transporter small permease subunit [Pseudomonadota bacterium]
MTLRKTEILQRWDDRLRRAELAVAAVLFTALACVVTWGTCARALGSPLIWSDETAVLLMASAAFPAASALLAEDGHVAITLLERRVPPGMARAIGIARDVSLLLIFLALAVLVWRWFAPVAEIARLVGQKTDGFPNFMYSEPTATLGLNKVWFWLSLPIFCIGVCFHTVVRIAARRGKSASC